MQIDLQTENVAKLIQLALGPVFLISGVGITLSMLTQRLARIVDRARTRTAPPRVALATALRATERRPMPPSDLPSSPGSQP